MKKIAEPIYCYRVNLPLPRAAQVGRLASLELPDKPSIAVLPFTNMSNDPEQETFVDGFTEDLITDLSDPAASSSSPATRHLLTRGGIWMCVSSRVI